MAVVHAPQVAVGVPAVEQVKEGAAPIARRDHIVTAIDLVAVEPHPHRLVVLDQHLLHLRLVVDLAAQRQVASFDRPRELQRPALREARVAVRHVGQLGQPRHHRYLGPAKHERHGAPQEGVAEAVGEVAGRDHPPAGEGGHKGQHAPPQVQPLLAVHELARLLRHYR